MSSTNENGYQRLLATPPPSPDGNREIDTPPELWSSGLCDCCSDASLCCVTCWCPSITFGRIAEAVDNGKTSCIVSGGIHAILTYGTGFGWIYSSIYRSKMREKYNLMSNKSPFQDYLAHLCCERCALCQEYREIQLRGSFPDGNEQKYEYGVEAVPLAPGGMIR